MIELTVHSLSNPARATLASCATPDTADTTYYYSANSAAALSTAFTNIANDIQRLRLSK